MKDYHGKRFLTNEDASYAFSTGDYSKALTYGTEEWKTAPYEITLVPTTTWGDVEKLINTTPT